MIRRTILTLCLLLPGCVSMPRYAVLSISDASRSVGNASIEGWIGFPGNVPLNEVEIGSTAKPLIQADDYDFRPCLTGVVSAQILGRLGDYDGQRVRLRGRLIRYDSLPLKPVGVLFARFYRGERVSNWCHSESILLIESVAKAS